MRFCVSPQNAVVLERSVLLNQLIERKSISWTRIFSDLEQVMPYNVALISVRLPQINSRNEVLLDMVVGAKEPRAGVRIVQEPGRIAVIRPGGGAQLAAAVPK